MCICVLMASQERHCGISVVSDLQLMGRNSNSLWLTLRSTKAYFLLIFILRSSKVLGAGCWGRGGESPCIALQGLLYTKNNCKMDTSLLTRKKKYARRTKVPNISSLNCNKNTDENKWLKESLEMYYISKSKAHIIKM